MNLASPRILAAVLGLVLVAMGQAAMAQNPELPKLALTGDILFGAGELTQDNNSQGGPAATIKGDLVGYWRDPRILQFEFRPMITLGEAVAGTQMGNAMTGFAATGIVLQGSSFPLTISYSRSGSSLEEGSNYTTPNQGVLSGAESNMTSTVFNANWTLRFRHLPVVNFNYSDTDYSSELPAGFSTGDDYTLRNFTAQANYSKEGWQAGARYQLTQSNTKFPDVVSGGVDHDNGNTTDIGFTASRLLPLNSSLSVSADDETSNFSWEGLKTDTTVRIANATFASQPVERVSTTLQVQYTSNQQAYQEQQALAGAGIPGAATSTVANSTAPVSPVPLTVLMAPFKVVTFSGAAGLRLGKGFSLNGSAADSVSSDNSGTSTRWSVGPAYQHKWRSGAIAASYSYSNMVTQADVVNENVQNPSQTPTSYSLFSETTDLNTGAVDLSLKLPRECQLAAAAHVSEGTIKDNGIPYPDHDYGGRATVTRPVRGWILTGSYSLEKNAANHELIYNESTSQGISFGVASRGLSLTGGRVYGSGLALQVGNSLIVVPNPVAITPVLGTPILTSTTGSTLMGSYRSRRGRVVVMGNWGHFNYTTDNFGTTNNLLNLQASYKLRHLRLIAGYMKQSQAYNVGSLGTYGTRLMYFQIERIFRVF